MARRVLDPLPLCPSRKCARESHNRSLSPAAANQRHICLEKLPPNTARAFMMREVMDLETDEICKELTINANNLWVILYRARMASRLCLEQNWFARTST